MHSRTVSTSGTILGVGIIIFGALLSSFMDDAGAALPSALEVHHHFDWKNLMTIMGGFVTIIAHLLKISHDMQGMGNSIRNKVDNMERRIELLEKEKTQ